MKVVLEPTRLTVIDDNGDEHTYGYTPYRYELAFERVWPAIVRGGPVRPEDHFWHTVKYHLPW